MNVQNVIAKIIEKLSESESYAVTIQEKCKRLPQVCFINCEVHLFVESQLMNESFVRPN